MNLRLRAAVAADAPTLGDICFRAFHTLATAHGFPPDFPDAEAAVGMMRRLAVHQGFFSVVAEIGGKVVGSNFLDARGPISAVGPITVDPDVQNDGVGRALMEAIMQRSRELNLAGIRLVQAGYHNRSLGLYLKLGFTAREHLACLQGNAIGKRVPGRMVRAATGADIAACNQLCLRVHGHARSGEVADAVAAGTARVVHSEARITGYTTALAFFGHSVGESNEDLHALFGAAEAFPGAGVLVPTRNSDLMRWCLGEKLRITQTLTLMSSGLYNEPNGAWLPSILY
jgi:GNAT superfamily N-acetyltransferase